MPLNRIAGAAVLTGVLLVSQGTAGQARAVGPVDIGFAQDMKVHHAQAVQLSAVAHGDDISGLAHTMAQGQGGEIELMQHLLLARGHQVEPSSGKHLLDLVVRHGGRHRQRAGTSSSRGVERR